EFYDNGGSLVTPTPTQAELAAFAPENVEDAWVLALYDVTVTPAEFVGYWPETQVAANTATAISGSCWTSIAPVGGGPVV
ncbi:MAG: hypothetical protein RIC38_05605, partial [Chromatocurvus sp.]